MRIAVNTLAVMPGITVSAETYTSGLVRTLLDVDTQNEYFLILRRDNGHIFPGKGKNVSHFVSPVGNRSRVKRVLWEQLILPWVCRSQRIDLILIPTGIGPIWLPCRSIVVVTLMLAFQIPGSLPWLQRYYYRCFHSLSIRHASRVVALSNQGRQDIQRNLGVDSTGIEVVYPGVPEEFRPISRNPHFSPIAEIGEGQEYLVAVGSVYPYKNLDVLIRAFGMIRTRGFPHRLVIASGGQTVPFYIKRLAEEIGVANEVCFVERFLSRQELVSLYSGAVVFVHPSSAEQFNLTVVEAMACGIPVITSDLPSFREQVGDAGLIVEVGNVEALCDGICKVLSEPALQREMAQRGQERSHQFSWGASARKMVAIFDQVMREPLKEYGPNA